LAPAAPEIVLLGDYEIQGDFETQNCDSELVYELCFDYTYVIIEAPAQLCFTLSFFLVEDDFLTMLENAENMEEIIDIIDAAMNELETNLESLSSSELSEEDAKIQEILEGFVALLLNNFRNYSNFRRSFNRIFGKSGIFRLPLRFSRHSCDERRRVGVFQPQ